MSCNLCHDETGHKDTCPTLIRVDWTTNRSEGSMWELLSREIFDEYIDTCVHETDSSWIDATRLMRQHIEDGDPYSAYNLLKDYRKLRG
jgi:hypothetical protein